MKPKKDLVVAQSLAEHDELKHQVGEFLKTGRIDLLTPTEIGRDDRCELGKWIHGPGRIHRGLVAFSELEACHLRVHQCAAQVVALALYSDKASADTVFRSHFKAHLRQWGQSLRNLEATLKG